MLSVAASAVWREAWQERAARRRGDEWHGDSEERRRREREDLVRYIREEERKLMYGVRALRVAAEKEHAGQLESMDRRHEAAREREAEVRARMLDEEARREASEGDCLRAEVALDHRRHLATDLEPVIPLEALRARDPAAIVALLKERGLAEETVAVEGVCALTRFTHNNVALQQLWLREGVAALVVRLLRAHHRSAALAVPALRVLRDVAAGTEAAREHVGAAGGCEAAMDALRAAAADDPRRARVALQLVAALAAGSPANRQRLAGLGGVRAVMELLAASDDNPRLVLDAVRALGATVAQHAANNERARELGALARLLDVMRAYSFEGCRATEETAAGIQQELVALGVVAPLLKALEEHCYHPYVVQYALQLCWLVATDPAAQAQVGAEGIELIMVNMERFGSLATLQYYALLALKSVTTAHEQLTYALCEQFDVIVEVLAENRDCVPVQEQGARLIAQLCANGPERFAILRTKSLNALAAAKDAHELHKGLHQIVDAAVEVLLPEAQKK